MAITIENWQQANVFTVTLRGHEQYIPLPEEPVREDTFDPASLNQSDIDIMIQNDDDKTNYNTIFDSYYAPADFKMKTITLRLPEQLPKTVEYAISIKVNGAEIELFPIPELQDHNQKIYGTECDVHIWEDDFIQISVTIEEDKWKKLSWNNHNLIVAVAGCFWYEEYASIFEDATQEWSEGASYFKTNITLQNRSGNDVFSDRIFADIVRSPISFILQSLRLSMFEDELMTDDKFPRIGSCFFVDVLVNGRSVNDKLGLPRPVSIDSLEQNLKSYNSVHDDVTGYPVLLGDDLLIRVYQRNLTAKFNSKILQVILIGCAPDCATLIATPVSVYELCTTEPCVTKFSMTKKCDTVPTKKNPIISCKT